MCDRPGHVPRLWSSLAWVVSLQCVTALVMYPDCGPVWHVLGNNSVGTAGMGSLQYVPALVGTGVGAGGSVHS